jgi:primosomal replication protein N
VSGEHGAVNLVRLSGKLIERGALRHTPAGVAAIEFRVAHASGQTEAGSDRKVECEMACVALGPTANLLAQWQPISGELELRITGFLAARSLKNRAVVLHANEIEFFEGN